MTKTSFQLVGIVGPFNGQSRLIFSDGEREHDLRMSLHDVIHAHSMMLSTIYESASPGVVSTFEPYERPQSERSAGSPEPETENPSSSSNWPLANADAA